MAEFCGVCKENEAIEKCSICGILLCDICKEEITIEDTHPSHRIKGESTPGIVGEGTKKKIVCPDCVTEVDID